MKPMRIIPIGGLGEIGRNMTLFETKDSIVAVDAGIMFPTNEMYGVDLVIPDISYLRENRKKFHGIIVTHGHEDHIGAIPYILEEFPKIKVYATKLTLGLIKNRVFKKSDINSFDFNEIEPGKDYNAGGLKFKPFRVNHSIADAVGFIIKTPYGNVVHTGDFKIDNTPVDGEIFDYHTLAEVGKQGVFLLMADSTNVLNTGYSQSERYVSDSLESLIKNAKSKVIVATFSSNIHRIQQIAEIALRNGKKLFASGYSLERNIELANKLGYLDVPASKFGKIENVKSIPDNQVVSIVSGTQGEPLSVLTKIANDRFKKLKIKEGDTVILSSSTIPGNESSVFGIINKLYKLGAEVYNRELEDVHVSGHASQEELKIMFNITKPKYFIPVHGEYRQLRRNALLANEVGIDNTIILEDGDILELHNHKITKKGNVEPEMIFVDGKGIGDISNAVIKDREVLGRDGFVLITVPLNKQSKSIQGEPEIMSRGFIYVSTSEEMLKKSRQIVTKQVKEWEIETRKDYALLKKKVRNALRRYYKSETAREPMILTHVVEI